ncbi:MAG: arginine--tRNA ligase [Candidatus Nomurabacteria bacterium]|jgi:arginyl-tRNA synthetase|nr:arginine--tRNA ligase [Candidatus Nomurabacteria bacterium]
MEKISKLIAAIVRSEFGVDLTSSVSISDGEHGDFSTNVAMQIAGRVGASPRDVAEKIVAKLDLDAEIAGPGFINITVSGRWLNDSLNDEWSEKFGENRDGAGKTVVVEYPSQNVAKPYSVGHLRPGNQGWAARNLMLATGWRVITDNHLGDYGAPFGIWVVGFRKFSSPEKLAEGGVYELGRVYVAMKAELKEEEKRGEHTLSDRVQEWLLKLESGDAEAVEYSQKFNEISLDHIHEVMGRLGISTEHELGEAFFAPRGKAEVQNLLDAGIAVKNPDGSIIVHLDEYGIKTPVLLQKSNGAALYATTDLATLKYREEQWHPDRVIYAVAAEQKFYFEQLFALAKKIGIKTELIHMWFGLIDQMNKDGTREKMSSRKGVILMEELLDQAETTARQNAKSPDMSDNDIRKIALGAIKFTDFSKDRRTNILFNWGSMFSLTGFSGPYVQYAAVRVNKILRDNIATPPAAISAKYNFEAEREVLKKLIEYPNTIKQAADSLEPHRVAQFAYDLARVVNRYYENTPVATAGVDADTKAARLGLLAKTAQVFAHSLNILGIEIPERM